MRRILQATLVALFPFASSPALAAPRTDCQPQAIRDLQRLSPQGHAIYAAMTDKKQFLFFLTCDNVQLGLATAVHESASRVSVDMRCMLEHLHLVVQDNGRGMGGTKRPGQRQSEPSCFGVGIPSIRARLRQFGGRLVIKSGLLRGTVLHAIVPIIAEATRDTGGRQSTGNSCRAFGVSADVKKKMLQ